MLIGAGAAACGASIGRSAGETTPSRQPAIAESKSSGPAMFHLLRRIATPACTGAREECPASDGHLVHLLLQHASRLRRSVSRSFARGGLGDDCIRICARFDIGHLLLALSCIITPNCCRSLGFSETSGRLQ